MMSFYLNKFVLIENKNGSKYFGKILGFKNQGSKFCLGQLGIINYAGGITCPKHNNTRWFNSNDIKILKHSDQHFLMV